MAAINMNMFAFACLFRPLPKASNKHKHQPNEQNLDASKEFAPLQEDALELHDVDADFHKDDDDMSHTKISRSRLGNCCASTSKVSGIPELCLTPYYPISMFTALIVGIVIYCVNLYIVPRALDHTYSKYQGAVLLTLIGIGSLIGRLVSGLLIDLKYASSQVVYMVSLASAAVELLLTPLLNTFAFLALFSALFGISIGISSSLVYVIAREVAPSWLLAPALGFTVLLVAGGNAFGTVIGGRFEIWVCVRQNKKNCLLVLHNFFRKGSVGQVFFSFFLFSSSLSHKISVGRSGKLFKNFLLFNKTFRSGEISVGQENFLKTVFGRATKHGRSVKDKQAIFLFFLIAKHIQLGVHNKQRQPSTI